MADLDERERADKVNVACRWYLSNLGTIQALLAEGELKIPHTDNPTGYSLYQKNWHLDYWLDRWEQKRLTLAEAEVLISDQLRPLFQVVRDRMTGTNQG